MGRAKEFINNLVNEDETSSYYVVADPKEADKIKKSGKDDKAAFKGTEDDARKFVKDKMQGKDTVLMKRDEKGKYEYSVGESNEPKLYISASTQIPQKGGGNKTRAYSVIYQGDAMSPSSKEYNDAVAVANHMSQKTKQKIGYWDGDKGKFVNSMDDLLSSDIKEDRKENIEKILISEYGWEPSDIEYWLDKGYSHVKILKMAKDTNESKAIKFLSMYESSGTIDSLTKDELDKLIDFIGNGVRPIKAAKLLFPSKPYEFVLVTKDLRNFAMNKITDINSPNKGYDLIWQRIYNKLPQYAKTINILNKIKKGCYYE